MSGPIRDDRFGACYAFSRFSRRSIRRIGMARQLNITYFADRDMLGLVSDEDYEQFKDLLLEAMHKEWPKATVAVITICR